MLSSDILTEFRGRSDELRVHPLSFAEYYSAVGGDKNEAFDEYAFYGGMPLILSRPDDAAKMNYLKSLFSESKRYDVKGKSYFDSPNKYYSEDIGLRNARIGFRQQEMTHIMENIIYNELIIKQFSVDVGVVYARTVNDRGSSVRTPREIDLAAEQKSLNGLQFSMKTGLYNNRRSKSPQVLF